MSRRLLPLGLVGLIVAMAITVTRGDEKPAEEPTDAPQFKLSSAVSAVTRYQNARKNAEAVYTRAMVAAKKECISDLDSALKHAMKTQNLEEANAIKAYRDRLQSEADELSPKPTAATDTRSAAVKARLAGSKWRAGTSAESPIITLRPDGVIAGEFWNGGGRWGVSDGGTILVIDQNGNKYRATISSDFKYAYWMSLNSYSAFTLLHVDSQR